MSSAARGRADPALAPAHPDPGERADRARVGGAEVRDGVPDRGDRHLLAAAHERVVGEPVRPAGRDRVGRVHGVRERAQADRSGGAGARRAASRRSPPPPASARRVRPPPRPGPRRRRRSPRRRPGHAGVLVRCWSSTATTSEPSTSRRVLAPVASRQFQRRGEAPAERDQVGRDLAAGAGHGPPGGVRLREHRAADLPVAEHPRHHRPRMVRNPVPDERRGVPERLAALARRLRRAVRLAGPARRAVRLADGCHLAAGRQQTQRRPAAGTGPVPGDHCPLARQRPGHPLSSAWTPPAAITPGRSQPGTGSWPVVSSRAEDQVRRGNDIRDRRGVPRHRASGAAGTAGPRGQGDSRAAQPGPG